VGRLVYELPPAHLLGGSTDMPDETARMRELLASEAEVLESPALWKRLADHRRKQGALPKELEDPDEARRLVDARPVRDSRILEVSITHADSAVANALCNELLRYHVNERLMSGLDAPRWRVRILDPCRVK
jgi:hypothetical protein